MRIGVDLGGTKIEIIALSTSGETLLRRRIPTPQGDYAAGVAAIVDLVRGVEAQIGAVGTLGIGIPGAISPATGLIKNANATWLIGHALDRDLAMALDREVRIENDANCFALSEAVDGAGTGHRVVFGAILGTGVGAGIAIDRRVQRGRHLIAGEWGHNPLPWPSAAEQPGPACYCGRAGCIERWVSGPAFAADHRQAAGASLTTPEIIAALRAGEADAGATYARYLDRLARALAHVINILDPDAIVLGGGMGNVDELYADLPRAVPAYVFSDECTTPILKPVHGDSGGVRGAAWLFGPA